MCIRQLAKRHSMLWVKMTLSIKSEMCKDRAMATDNKCTKFCEVWTCVFFRYASKQTQTYRQERHTDMLIAVLFSIAHGYTLGLLQM